MPYVPDKGAPYVTPALAPNVTAKAAASNVTTREVTFFSEAVQSHAKLFLPAGFSSTSNAPAVIVAPDRGQTAAAIESQAAELAARGVVGVAIDYRGWGKSGAFIYLADQVRWDDRLRFSQHTAKVRLRRKRLLPEAQVTDIRNAITYIQGEPGVDPARIGVMGTGLAGSHVVGIAANDSRVKAGVAIGAIEAGKGVERRSFAPTAAQQAVMVKLARTGQAPATAASAAAMNDEESRIALAEYEPFRIVDQIPKEAAMLHLERTASVDQAAAEFLAKALIK